MVEKKLGRGLDYLLQQKKPDFSDGDKIKQVKISKINKNRHQPRSFIDNKGLEDLIASIKNDGLLQPILLKKREDSFELIAGERRLRACIALNYEEIPAIILDVSDNKLLQLALVENIQRENLNSIEEANAYQAMIQLEQLSHEEVSKRLGKNRSTITNTLRLLELPKEIQESVSRGTISFGHARALLGFSDKKEMLKVSRKVFSSGLSVREVEKLSKRSKEKSVDNTTTNVSHSDRINIETYENALKASLGTKVGISLKGDKGIVKIHFYSKPDFSRLFDLLTNPDR